MAGLWVGIPIFPHAKIQGLAADISLIISHYKEKIVRVPDNRIQTKPIHVKFTESQQGQMQYLATLEVCCNFSSAGYATADTI